MRINRYPDFVHIGFNQGNNVKVVREKIAKEHLVDNLAKHSFSHFCTHDYPTSVVHARSRSYLAVATHEHIDLWNLVTHTLEWGYECSTSNGEISQRQICVDDSGLVSLLDYKDGDGKEMDIRLFLKGKNTWSNQCATDNIYQIHNGELFSIDWTRERLALGMDKIHRFLKIRDNEGNEKFSFSQEELEVFLYLLKDNVHGISDHYLIYCDSTCKKPETTNYKLFVLDRLTGKNHYISYFSSPCPIKLESIFVEGHKAFIWFEETVAKDHLNKKLAVVNLLDKCLERVISTATIIETDLYLPVHNGLYFFLKKSDEISRGEIFSINPNSGTVDFISELFVFELPLKMDLHQIDSLLNIIMTTKDQYSKNIVFCNHRKKILHYRMLDVENKIKDASYADGRLVYSSPGYSAGTIRFEVEDYQRRESAIEKFDDSTSHSVAGEIGNDDEVRRDFSA